MSGLIGDQVSGTVRRSSVMSLGPEMLQIQQSLWRRCAFIHVDLRLNRSVWGLQRHSGQTPHLFNPPLVKQEALLVCSIMLLIAGRPLPSPCWTVSHTKALCTLFITGEACREGCLLVWKCSMRTPFKMKFLGLKTSIDVFINGK